MADTGLSGNSKATTLVSAPENPAFVKHQQTSSILEPSVDGHKTGFVPSTVDTSHIHAISSVKSLPSKYDLRTLNKVTSVKDQGSAGTCWAFATYGSLESYLMPGENWDFSENNLKNVLSTAAPAGFDFADGGNSFMSTAYLSRWSGAVKENDDPYSASSVYSPSELTLPIYKHLQNTLIPPDRQGSLDNNGIKSAVQNYGALYTTMYYDKACYSSTTNSYYFNGSSYSNHAVSIVGWNDDYDKNNFSQVPPGNGAFIVKNSWGTGWGENGYFYVSYYDSKIGKENAIFTAENTNNYKNVYQYDPLGWTRDCGYGTSTGWCANIFTAKSDDSLKAVSFYTTDSNCNYEIYVYTDVSSSPISQVSPVASKSGTSSFAGYHTIPLNSAVQLKSGQKFSVVLKLTTTGYGYPIAIERPEAGYSSKATANSGESFVSSDGKTWGDVTNYFGNTNVCIKAFTNTVGGGLLANFSANPTSGSAPLNVAFNDTSTGTPTKWKWNFGDKGTSTLQNPTHKYSKTGNYTVSLTVSNAAGSNTTTKPNYITVVAKPVANLASNVTSGKVPFTVFFTDKSSGSPTSWNWDFGDGATSTDKNPTHQYLEEGSYTVKLTVTNAVGNNTVTKTNYVKATTSTRPGLYSKKS
jgi:Cysteine protease